MITTADLDRDQIREALAEIVASHHGVLNPRAVLDRARDPAHVLHRFFEWDDGAAAEAYRLAQVGMLIRRVRYTVVRTDPRTRAVTLSTTRAYESRPSMRQADRGYESIESLLSDDTKRAELLAHVLQDLAAYRKRYEALSELQAIWIAVDDARLEYSPPSTAPGVGDSRDGAAG
jgi:hypothetical protein